MFARAIYPAVLFGGCALAALLLPLTSVVAASVITVAVAVVILVALEKALPYSPAWKPSAATVRLDIVHSLVSSVVVSSLARITSMAAAVWIGVALSARIGGALWPASLPLPLQVALALVIADLGAYGAHRWMHASETGWRLHAVHHTPRQLYVVASGRSHPLNALLTMTCESVPVIILGITPEAFALLAVFKAVNGLLQHSNVAMKPGILSWLIATSDVHRFHHSRDMGESNTNFGNTTMIWDHVFGTYYLPHRQPGTAVGIAGAEIPESYLTHLLVPFQPRRDR